MNYIPSVPGVCAHHYGEVRAKVTISRYYLYYLYSPTSKVTVPGSQVVSGPRCCHGSCPAPRPASAAPAVLQPLV